MTASLTGPIGILDEHPDWSRRLHRRAGSGEGLPWEKIDHSSHAFDPRDRRARHSVIVNRTSPSSHTRGHRGVLFYAEALLAHYESLGIPVVNPSGRLSLREVQGAPAGALRARGGALSAEHGREPSDPGARRARRAPPAGGRQAERRRIGRGHRAGRLEGASSSRCSIGSTSVRTAPRSCRSIVEPVEGAIVRVEVLGGEYLYADPHRARHRGGFNLCPADICQVPEGSTAPRVDLGACPVSAPAGLTVSRFDAPGGGDRHRDPARARGVHRRRRRGVPGLEGRRPDLLLRRQLDVELRRERRGVVGFDPTARFADFIVRRARREAQAAAA